VHLSYSANYANDYQNLSVILVDVAMGTGMGSSAEESGESSRGGGALRSEPRCSSNHLSISSERPRNGRLPRRVIMSSLCAYVRADERLDEKKERTV
jgi:hypothetical protein